MRKAERTRGTSEVSGWVNWLDRGIVSLKTLRILVADHMVGDMSNLKGPVVCVDEDIC